MQRSLVPFLTLCLIWGATWIGIKAGVATVPPLFFAGSRFAAAGVLILAVARLRAPLPKLAPGDLPRLCWVTLFMIPLSYGPLFWGMVHVDSGTAAVLELSLTPVALLGFALALRDERFDARRLLAILLGVAGLSILFLPTALESLTQAGSSRDPIMTLLGAIAVATAAVVYAWGSVLARPLLAVYPTSFIAGATTLFGGIVLTMASLAIEPGAAKALAGNWGWPAWAGWLFLVLFGSLIGYTLFMRLLRDVGASRAGSYAFVSPVVAVLLGIAVYGEEVGTVELAGMAVMLTAAWLALRETAEAREA